jgi:hypothetical protein
MFLGLNQCVDKLRILSEFSSPILLLQYSIRQKHGRKSFLNLISIRWFFLTKLQLRANFMNNMIVVCNGLDKLPRRPPSSCSRSTPPLDKLPPKSDLRCRSGMRPPPTPAPVAVDEAGPAASHPRQRQFRQRARLASPEAQLAAWHGRRRRRLIRHDSRCLLAV